MARVPSFTSPWYLALAVCAAGACAAPPVQETDLDEPGRLAIADSLRDLLRSTLQFGDGNPVDRFMSLYADTGRVISAASGSFSESRDSLRRSLVQFWEGAGRFMRHPEWTWGPMAIDVLSPDAAVVTARYTIPHWTPAGRPHVLGGAWTTVWTRRHGQWRIVQEHLSDLPRSVAERAEAGLPSIAPDTGTSR